MNTFRDFYSVGFNIGAHILNLLLPFSFLNVSNYPPLKFVATTFSLFIISSFHFLSNKKRAYIPKYNMLK